ncbi:hypothetical protein [uncultured Ruminococcus sp.]|uniref:hypothetical protein n=1 Tax=uncultured Ruminococcus sp. TaxID=165186 RepID=UPI00261C1AB5|nr:hypothetical protein [uncultured Ruminococcus sp.]
MSTKEMLLHEIEAMNEAQMQGLLLFIRGCYADVPNEETLAAMEEVEEMKHHPEQYPGYTDVDEMMKDLLQ